MVGKSSPLVVDGRLYAFDDGGKLYIHRRGHRQAGGQEADQAGRHDHAGQPAVCRRQDLCLHDQRLARARADERRREVRATDATAGRGRSHRLADHFARPDLLAHRASRLYCLGKPDAKPGRPRPLRQPKETPAGKDDAGPSASRAGRSADQAGREAEVHGQAVQRPRAISPRCNRPSSRSQDPARSAPTERSAAASDAAPHGHDRDGQGGRAAPARLAFAWCPSCPGSSTSPTAKCRSPGSAPAIATSSATVDGNKVMVKVTTIPKGTRSQAMHGPERSARLHDSGRRPGRASPNGKMPDIGRDRPALHAGPDGRPPGDADSLLDVAARPLLQDRSLQVGGRTPGTR